MSSSSPKKVDSAFQVLGMTQPQIASQNPDQGERFIQALTGQRPQLPVWSGQPNTLRSWLKILAYWESETTVHKSKWGMKLYQSFAEGSQPRRIADQVPLQDLLSSEGYGLVLSAIMDRYRPFLEVAGPASVDKFFFAGDRAKNESFATYIASKIVAKQELEMQLGESLNPKIAGRILMRQAHLSDFQRELIALKDQNQLLSFGQVAEILRPLDKPELIAQAANAELGSSGAKHFPVMKSEAEHASNDYDMGQDEDYIMEESEEEEDEEDDQLEFEDREYQEDEMVYLQAYHTAYADVRRDLRDQRRERGFVRHGDRGGRLRKGGRERKGRGRFGKGKKGGKKSTSLPNTVRGNIEDLKARTRCYNCQELGHIAKDCPLKNADPKKKVNFVVCTGGGQSQTFVLFRGPPPTLPPVPLTVLAGVRVRGCEAVVDTAAEDAVIGDMALKHLKETLAQQHMQVVVVVEGAPHTPCAGIGGEARIHSVVDAPVSVCGINGVLRFTVLKDNDNFKTPPLLPISFLEAIRATVDLDANELRTPDGHQAPMTRLPSGHRSVQIVDITGAWHLPEQCMPSSGCDPFRLPEASLAWPASSSSSGNKNFRGNGGGDGAGGDIGGSAPTSSRSLPTASTSILASTATATSTTSTAPPTSILATSLPEEGARKFLREKNFSYEALQSIIEASFVINVNMKAFPHGDHHNCVHTFNGTVSLGSFSKGELWIQFPPGEQRGAQDSLTQWRRTKQGKRVLGKLISTHHSPLVFDPKLLHATCRWTGTRISVSL